ncbi:CaiB/BaiF CoA transferase family protein [Lutispora sp.]|uniref:CaiB/BaiF CoA transferase family protein n=1 Tax=Lutispora sp. TaxID=2828727 RepID=UPI002B21DE20|nr:CaiB/BaiF CoA-transferase family protein [Lutispora sp.]MEA4963036.1 CaiB/BaiF CoA-transferase family protein [Lutispora sp.]
MRKPLEHIKVLDFTRVLAGPYCTMILANMGAEIIKIERPGSGDDSRDFGPFMNGQSAYFVSINRGKKSIALDLKSPKAIELVKELVKEVDIVAENFRPGTMEKLGLGYEELKKINPKLIFATMSGFGQTGPYSKRPAYDMIVQGMGGIMSITGEEGGDPVRVGTSIGDITAGMFGTIGILAALVDRDISGEGRMVDVAMLDGQLSILENAISRYTATGEIPKPLGARHPSIAPFEAYKTKDSYVIVACGNDALWEKFCKLTSREDLLAMDEFKTNPDRVKNVRKLKEYMTEIFGQKTTAEWDEYLNKNGIPCSAINTVDKLFTDPQVTARKMLVEVEQPGAGKIKIAGNPIKLSGLEEEIPKDPAPQIGEHSELILKKYLGYTDEQIAELKKQNII